jgi:hypothetical protein
MEQYLIMHREKSENISRIYDPMHYKNVPLILYQTTVSALFTFMRRHILCVYT